MEEETLFDPEEMQPPFDAIKEEDGEVSRIMKVNGHSFSRFFGNQIGDNFNRIY